MFNAATGQRAGGAGRQGVARSSNPIGRIVGNHNVQGYLYIAPWLFGFLVFGLKPLIELIYHSFTKYNLLRRQTSMEVARGLLMRTIAE